MSSADIGGFDDPSLAIDGGADGLGVARACVAACHGHLAPGASLLLQLGTHEQADAISASAAGQGWRAEGRRSAGPTETSGGGVILRLLHP